MGTFRFHAAPGSQSGTNRTKADIFVKYDNNKAMMKLTHWKDINEESIGPNHLRKMYHRLAYKLHYTIIFVRCRIAIHQFQYQITSKAIAQP